MWGILSYKDFHFLSAGVGQSGGVHALPATNNSGLLFDYLLGSHKKKKFCQFILHEKKKKERKVLYAMHSK